LPDGFLIVALYVVAVCGPLLVSGYRNVALFGVVNLVAVVIIAKLTFPASPRYVRVGGHHQRRHHVALPVAKPILTTRAGWRGQGDSESGQQDVQAAFEFGGAVVGRQYRCHAPHRPAHLPAVYGHKRQKSRSASTYRGGSGFRGGSGVFQYRMPSVNTDRAAAHDRGDGQALRSGQLVTEVASRVPRHVRDRLPASRRAETPTAAYLVMVTAAASPVRARGVIRETVKIS